MKLSVLQRFGGVSLILGALLLTAYSVFFYLLLPVAGMSKDPIACVMNPHWIWIAATAFFGVIFMMFGFMAVYSRIHEGAGVLGFLGFVFIELAYFLQGCKVTWEIFMFPIIAGNEASSVLFRGFIIEQNSLHMLFMTAASVTILLGIIFFCTALIRSKEFPKLAGILIFAGALIYGFGPLLTTAIAIAGIIILSIGCLILGMGLNKKVTIA